jgi:mannose-6-phosphate isomerase-like protein (cupin superfamily)
MAYHVIDPADLDELDDRPASVKSVSAAVGLDTLGLRIYRADPGEQIPLGMHYHDEQEEAFYVVEGDLHVETPDGEFVVPTGQLFVVTPGNPHRAFNPADASSPLEVVAIGAPSVDDVHAVEP